MDEMYTIVYGVFALFSIFCDGTIVGITFLSETSHLIGCNTYFLFCSFFQTKSYVDCQCKPSLLHVYITQSYSLLILSFDVFVCHFDPRQTWTCTHSKVTTCVHVYSDLQTCLICIACRIPRTQPFNTESFITRQDPTGNTEIQKSLSLWCVMESLVVMCMNT